MGVHAPGRVNLGGLGLRRGGLGRAIARALPSSPPLGGGRRKVIASISMTSMIDVLVVMTVFLLFTFQASSECGCITRLSHLPEATNILDAIDAPMVHVAANSAMLLDGSEVASSEELAAAQDRVMRIDGLFNRLRQRRELAKVLHPGREPLTEVMLAIDGDVPASVVKSIVLTAARSGYPSINFMVTPAPKG